MEIDTKLVVCLLLIISILVVSFIHYNNVALWNQQCMDSFSENLSFSEFVSKYDNIRDYCKDKACMREWGGC